MSEEEPLTPVTLRLLGWLIEAESPASFVLWHHGIIVNWSLRPEALIRYAEDWDKKHATIKSTNPA